MRPGAFSHEHEIHARERYSIADAATEQYRTCSACYTPPSSASSSTGTSSSGSTSTTTSSSSGAGASSGIEGVAPRRYRCTQTRKGHGSQHRNPAFLDVEATGVRGWFGWCDRIPCQWEGEFRMADSTPGGEDEWIRGLAALIDTPEVPTNLNGTTCTGGAAAAAGGEGGGAAAAGGEGGGGSAGLSAAAGSGGEEEKGGGEGEGGRISAGMGEYFFWKAVGVFVGAGHLGVHQSTWHKHTCMRCLTSTGSGEGKQASQIHMLNRCGHHLCRECIEEGRAAAQHQEATGPSTPISTAAGGGGRGSDQQAGPSATKICCGFWYASRPTIIRNGSHFIFHAMSYEYHTCSSWPSHALPLSCAAGRCRTGSQPMISYLLALGHGSFVSMGEESGASSKSPF